MFALVANASPRYRESIATLPILGWDKVAERVDKYWIAEDAPHHSIVGQTRSGKSYLITRGILPLCQNDRVLIIDNKGDDPTLKGTGKPVVKLNRITRDLWIDKRQPRSQWYRLIVHDDWAAARHQVSAALNVVFKEGNWVVVVDETRALTDPREPSLGLRPQLEQLWLRGGSKGISVIAGTQAPRWVPSSFYDQPSFVWIGRVEDQAAQKRMMEIGGLTKDLLPQVGQIERRSWLYLDNITSNPKFMGITSVGKG